MQGAASGEAFIQMDSEKSSESTALTKNKKLMFVSGVRRYVEVIQCSGDEMALVLQQGLPAPTPSVATPVLPHQSPAATLHTAAAAGGTAAVLPTAGFWSLPPPPSAQTTDLTLLLQQPNTIPLHSATGRHTPASASLPCLSYAFIWKRSSTQPDHPYVGRHNDYQRKLGRIQRHCAMH